MQIDSLFPVGFAPVPYSFIDRYMTGANGEFVKTYLLLLRLSGEGSVSVSVLADRLDQTEKDVRRALKYWEKAGLLSLRELDGEILSLRLLLPEEKAGASAPAEEAAARTAAPQPETAPAPKAEEPPKAARSISAAQIRALKDRQDFAELIVAAEHYLARTLNSRDVDMFAYLYGELGFPGDVLEYLIEYCVDIWERRGKKKDYTLNRYIEKVALSWHQAGALTLEAAKKQVKLYDQDVASFREVEKALGLKGRQLTEEECGRVLYWTGELGMSRELIIEACRRTIRSKGTANFEYLEGILKSWKQEGVGSVAQAREADERRARQKEAPRSKEKPQTERRVDYDAAVRDAYIQSVKTASEG